MKIEISKDNIELLDGLKKQEIEHAKHFGREDIANLWTRFDYNDLITVLNLGYSEKAFFNAIQDNADPQMFELTADDLDNIYQGLLKFLNQK